MSDLRYRCPRCGQYSMTKDPSECTTMIVLTSIVFLLACVTGSGFLVIAWLLLIVVTICTLVVKLISIIRRRNRITYTCDNCKYIVSEVVNK